jgi:aminopeptidase N
VIDIEVREPTARLTLNAVNTTFASVTADDSAGRADVVLDAAGETATFIFAQPLAAGPHRLRTEFTKRCPAPTFRIAIAVKTFPLEAFFHHG